MSGPRFTPEWGPMTRDDVVWSAPVTDYDDDTGPAPTPRPIPDPCPVCRKHYGHYEDRHHTQQAGAA